MQRLDACGTEDVDGFEGQAQERAFGFAFDACLQGAALLGALINPALGYVKNYLHLFCRAGYSVSYGPQEGLRGGVTIVCDSRPCATRIQST